MDRRSFIKTSGAAVMAAGLVNSSLFAGTSPAGIGMCDWNLPKGSANPDIIAKAAEVTLQGIQVSVATSPDNVPLRDPKVRQQYVELGKKNGITFHSVAAGSILNKYALATEPQSAVYVIDAIEAAQTLGAKNILIAFFGNGDLLKKDADGKYYTKTIDGYNEHELDEARVEKVIDCLKQIAPRAEAAGVALGLENTLSAKQNLKIIEGIGSPIAQVYYDVGNSWGNGYNVPAEIRKLGNDRICEVHLKDWKTKILGDDKAMVDMDACSKALTDINYDKWLVLETSGRKNEFEADTKTNVAFSKRVFGVS